MEHYYSASWGLPEWLWGVSQHAAAHPALLESRCMVCHGLLLPACHTDATESVVTRGTHKSRSPYSGRLLVPPGQRVKQQAAITLTGQGAQAAARAITLDAFADMSTFDACRFFAIGLRGAWWAMFRDGAMQQPAVSRRFAGPSLIVGLGTKGSGPSRSQGVGCSSSLDSISKQASKPDSPANWLAATQPRGNGKEICSLRTSLRLASCCRFEYR